VLALMAGGREAIFTTKEDVEDHYADGMTAITPLHPTKKDVVIGVSGQRDDPVRPWRAHRRAQGRRADHLRDLRPRTELSLFVDLTILARRWAPR
jgi:hypothetical protein